MKKGQVAIFAVVAVLVVVGIILAFTLINPGKPSVEKKCGDGKCSADENWKICPADCSKPTKAVCGNKVCESGEELTCKADCPKISKCGDNICDAKEKANNLCPVDCGSSGGSSSGGGGEGSGGGNGSSGNESGGGTLGAGYNFGVAGGIERYSSYMKDAGVEFDREWIVWKEIEPVNNQYNWQLMDEKVSKANQAGIKVLGYFIDTPDWAELNPNCPTTTDICALKDMNEFKEFARDAAERYDGNHGHGTMEYIEILNEVTNPEFFEKTNNSYADWLVNGYEGVKAGNQNAKVLIGAFVSTPPDSFVNDMLQNYNQYYDIVNFHVYETEDKETETTQYFKNKMVSYNINKPMWITETATVSTQDADAMDRIAKDVVKRYARAFGLGVEKVFWWPFIGVATCDEYSGAGCNTGKIIGLGWGLKTDNIFHPRQAYNTYKLMTSKLAGFSSVERITDTEYKFVVNGKSVYVLWGAGSVPSGLTGTVKVTDYLGNIETKLASSIVLDDNPVFIEVI